LEAPLKLKKSPTSTEANSAAEMNMGADRAIDAKRDGFFSCARDAMYDKTMANLA